MRRRTSSLLALLLLCGCATNTEDPGIGTHGGEVVAPTKVEAIAALLPAKVRGSGKLVVGVNVPYMPNEFRDSTGMIVGFDVDLMNAVSRVLGVVPHYSETPFEKIIPAIEAGTVDVGMSSFTDSLARQKTVDFTDYFNAGIQWAQRVGGRDLDPADACGRKVAVQATTVEDTQEIPAKSARCVADGKPPITKLAFDDQSGATTALLLGQVDAVSADSPVTAYSIRQHPDALRTVGPVFDSAPYGWPTAKGSPLARALREAAQHLMDNGDYRTVCRNWGLESGMIEKSVINGAQR